MNLLKMQIGPVQEFIAQARSTRDLWSGSYLLSWLTATGLQKLRQECPVSKIIFPAVDQQPLCRLHAKGKRSDGEANPERYLLPSIPNLFLAEVPDADAAELARKIEKAIRVEWETIAEQVWKHLFNGAASSENPRYGQQVKSFLVISWQVTSRRDHENWSTWASRNGRDLAAVRQTRQFVAWSVGGWDTGSHCNKDSLTGREEGIVFDDFQPTSPQLAHRFKHGDTLGAITLIKRVWDIAYLQNECGLPSLGMPNTHGVARHKPTDDTAEQDVSGDDEQPYFAVLAFDGDKMGKWACGEKHRFEDTAKSPEDKTAAFSAALTTFALERVRSIVEKPGVHDGRLIYAGGDDVLALLPADTALACASALRAGFRKADILGDDGDASVGIAIAHVKAPLQDVVREARTAEQRAKHQLDRSAVAVTIFKRSGEISEWGCKWDDGGLDLHKAIGTALDTGMLSAKFPHRAIELFEAYRIGTSTPTAKARTMTDAAGFTEVVDDLIRREFGHALSRQRDPARPSQALADSFTNHKNTGLLDIFLANLAMKKPEGPECCPQEKLARLTGLLTAVAFAHRTRPNIETPPKGIAS